MKKEIYDKLEQKIDNLEKLLNGGKGSGNFGHSGRPGQVGGSGDGGVKTEETSAKRKVLFPEFKDEKDYYDEIKGQTHSGSGLTFIGRKKEGMEKIGYKWDDGGYRKDESKPSSSTISKQQAFEYAVGEDIEMQWRYGGIQQSKKSRFKRIKEILDSPDDAKFEVSDSGKAGFAFKFKRIDDKKR